MPPKPMKVAPVKKNGAKPQPAKGGKAAEKSNTNVNDSDDNAMHASSDHTL